jgi:hypothetical protein
MSFRRKASEITWHSLRPDATGNFRGNFKGIEFRLSIVKLPAKGAYALQLQADGKNWTREVVGTWKKTKNLRSQVKPFIRDIIEGELGAT